MLSYPLFTRFGVELEYMLVARDTLAVLPAADQVLYAVSGEYGDADVGELSWSNELVLHVIELKTNGPATTLAGLAEFFQRDVRRINALLAPLGGRLMPTAMHPWMDPLRETRLWPHEYSAVYESFDRLFNCRGHGWSNVQSVHLNLPFADDEEFGRLHAAIRLLLPILPALAASSPVVEGRLNQHLDARMEYYRHNSRRIPSVAGRIIPEPVFTQRAYQREILERIYRDLAPHDPDGVLRYEWANARGAIARFERNTIEIRVIDMQECPRADLAIVQLIVAVLRGLTEQRWSSYAEQRAWDIAPLERLFLATVRDAGGALIDDPAYLRLFGLEHTTACPAAGLWDHLRRTVFSTDELAGPGLEPLGVIVSKGCLARRIVDALRRPARDVSATPGKFNSPVSVPRERLAELYAELCECLTEGRMFAD